MRKQLRSFRLKLRNAVDPLNSVSLITRLALLWDWLSRDETVVRKSPDWFEIARRWSGGRSLVISTSQNGLWLLHRNTVFHIFGHSYCFGLFEESDTSVLVSVSWEFSSGIYRVSLKGEEPRVELVRAGLPKGVHQICVDSTRILLTDTYSNRVLAIALFLTNNERGQGEIKYYYPDGILEKGRYSLNYRHFNSIRPHSGGYLLLAHNETSKTKKPSELLFLNSKMQIVKREVLDAGNAHDVEYLNGSLFLCDSLGGRVLKDGEELHAFGSFVRGIDCNGDGNLLVGGSPFVDDRNTRANIQGAVLHYYDMEKCEEQSVDLGLSQVHDLLLVAGND